MAKIIKSISAVTLILLVVASAIFFGVVCSTGKSEIESVVIKQGMSGAQVKTVQTKLKTWGYYTGAVDGIFGAKTLTAVKSFQQKNGITVDGVIGEKTASKMGIKLTTSSSSNSSYSGNDVYLLAKCIYAEARGEPYTGQVAVGAVVLNRVKSSKFPNTIPGVIYQPWAFTAVHDGQINLEPNDTAKRAAKDALSGWDPSNGCIYYFNPSTATSTWIWSRQIKLKIGKHNFAV